MEIFLQHNSILFLFFISKDYHPVFKVLDEVTGITSTYTGKYSLRVLAGGLVLNEMKPFDVTANMYETFINNYIYVVA